MEIITKKKGRKYFSAKKEYFFENYDKNVDINVQATARSFGVSRVTIYRWIKEFNQEQ